MTAERSAVEGVSVVVVRALHKFLTYSNTIQFKRTTRAMSCNGRMSTSSCASARISNIAPGTANRARALEIGARWRHHTTPQHPPDTRSSVRLRNPPSRITGRATRPVSCFLLTISTGLRPGNLVCDPHPTIFNPRTWCRGQLEHKRLASCHTRSTTIFIPSPISDWFATIPQCHHPTTAHTSHSHRKDCDSHRGKCPARTGELSLRDTAKRYVRNVSAIL